MRLRVGLLSLLFTISGLLGGCGWIDPPKTDELKVEPETKAVARKVSGVALPRIGVDDDYDIVIKLGEGMTGRGPGGAKYVVIYDSSQKARYTTSVLGTFDYRIKFDTVASWTDMSGVKHQMIFASGMFPSITDEKIESDQKWPLVKDLDGPLVRVIQRPKATTERLEPSGSPSAAELEFELNLAPAKKATIGKKAAP